MNPFTTVKKRSPDRKGEAGVEKSGSVKSWHCGWIRHPVDQSSVLEIVPLSTPSTLTESTGREESTLNYTKYMLCSLSYVAIGWKRL